MKIDSSSRIGTTPTRRAGKPRATGGGSSFSSHIPSGGDDTAPTGGAQSPVSVNPLLAVQEVADATSGAARAKARAEAMLDHLDELQLGLLAGHMPRSRIEDLARLARDKRDHDVDPRLKDVLDQIELRARVELAKLDAEV